MKNKILLYLILYLVISCVKDDKTLTEIATHQEEQITSLPFTNIELNDVSAFKPVTENWKIVGDVVADRTKKQTFAPSNGTGVLLNTPQEENKEHLFTNFDHEDIEIEFDVMMPVKSNSGVYFQGRYEIQLFDSWGTETPKHSDIGGIYQRWNDKVEKGKEGYEGHAPRLNAGKAPGLWQHFKVLFRAPKFDESGNKIKNAKFEEVFLNGRLLHKNVELNGPTRSSAFNDEQAMGPLMIQGDHGAVAFKSIKYKLYSDKTIEVKNTTLKVYENHTRASVIKSIDSFSKTSEIKTNIISPMNQIDRNERNISIYSGTLNIPASGDYLFEMNVNGGGIFIVNNDTIINFNNAIKAENIIFKTTHLTKGDASFEILYNRTSPWNRNFDLFIEGPKMQRYSIRETDKKYSTRKQKHIKPITVNPTNAPITQRSFIIHKGVKRTHCIAVGLTEKLNYSLDLATGSLLQVWGGDFFNTTQMWDNRGEEQIGEPSGFIVSSHGELDFALLDNNEDEWPNLNENTSFKSLGYEFNNKQIPAFSFQLDEAKITYKFTASTDEKRGLNRFIEVNSKKKDIWHKIADGNSIKKLNNNTYVINNESYYINFLNNETAKPIIRSSNGNDELLIKIPKGNSTINYTIIW